jgi:1,5-anhydro-D-fructose reductase (1,5-anhydro-D-mannitol-forming)
MQINVGIIGCGKITAAHMNGFKELKEKGLLGEVVIRGLCSLEKDEAVRFRQRGEGPAPLSGVGPEDDPMRAPHVYVSDFQDESLPDIYTDYRDLLARGDLDAVFVLTPVHLHHRIALAALESGIHTLVEKPFAVSVKTARIMTEAARSNDRICGVAESLHYYPNVQKLKWLIDRGYLGTVQFFQFTGIGGFWSPDRIVGETSWRHRKVLAGGGASVDSMVHYFHVLRFLLGEIHSVAALTAIVEPVRTTLDFNGLVVEQVRCEVDDTISCSVRFTGGAVGNLFFSWAGHGPSDNFPGNFHGTRGYSNGSQVVLDGEQPTSLDDFFEANASSEEKLSMSPHGIQNAFTREIHDFFQAIHEGRAMVTSAMEGTRDLAVSFAALESSHTGRWVRVEDVFQGIVGSYEDEINRELGI